jgi:hypothetical protein
MLSLFFPVISVMEERRAVFGIGFGGIIFPSLYILNCDGFIFGSV